MRIPEVAKRMREMSSEIQKAFPNQSAELVELAEELKRRHLGPRAPATSTPMTPELAEDIREFAKSNPGMSHQDIGVVFNVNPGRVSESLGGKRT